MSVFRWKFQTETSHPHTLFHPCATGTKVAQLQCCSCKVCHSFFSHKLCSLDTAGVRGCRLPEIPGIPLTANEAADLWGWVCCCHSKNNPYCRWMEAPHRHMQKHEAPLSFPAAQQASKDLCVSHLPSTSAKKYWNCIFYVPRQVLHHDALEQTLQAFSLPFPSSLDKPFNLNHRLAAEFIHIWVLSCCVHSNLHQTTYHRISNHLGLTLVDLSQTYTCESRSIGQQARRNITSDAVTCVNHNRIKSHSHPNSRSYRVSCWQGESAGECRS